VPAAAQQAASPLQGFSIVLVQGDMAASDGRADLPEAAARAVGDMKGLLPFRSYRLVDSAWVLADSASGLINARLKGPDNVDYDVVMEALPAPGGAQRVAFRLRESGHEAPQTASALERDLETLNTIAASLRRKYEHALTAQALEGRGASGDSARATVGFLRTQLAEAERRVAEFKLRLAADPERRGTQASRVDALHQQADAQRQRIRRLEEELKAVLGKLHEHHPDAMMLRQQLAEARVQLQSTQTLEQALSGVSVTGRSSAPAGATLIETMFTMRLGETVVVGTSRTGVDKALVAVLTAVPQPKGRGGF